MGEKNWRENFFNFFWSGQLKVMPWSVTSFLHVYSYTSHFFMIDILVIYILMQHFIYRLIFVDMIGTSIFTNGHFNIIILLIVNLKIITDFNKIKIFQCHRLAKIKAWSYKKKNCKKIKAHKKSVQNNSYR